MKALFKDLVLLLFVTGITFHVEAQTVSSTADTGAAPPSSRPDLELSISAAQSWTDTGLELHPGDILELTASAPPSRAPAGTGQSANSCDTSALSANSSNNLQLSSAPPGALIGKLHSQGGEPFLVGEKKELKIEEQSHLFLGLNVGSPPICQRTLSVKVHVASAITGQTTAPPKDSKSKLAAAAQTWIAGQFGTGSTGTSAPAANEASPAGDSAANSSTTPAP